jgi:hypothetical protein
MGNRSAAESGLQWQFRDRPALAAVVEDAFRGFTDAKTGAARIPAGASVLLSGSSAGDCTFGTNTAPSTAIRIMYIKYEFDAAGIAVETGCHEVARCAAQFQGSIAELTAAQCSARPPWRPSCPRATGTCSAPRATR